MFHFREKWHPCIDYFHKFLNVNSEIIGVGIVLWRVPRYNAKTLFQLTVLIRAAVHKELTEGHRQKTLILLLSSQQLSDMPNISHKFVYILAYATFSSA